MRSFKQYLRFNIGFLIKVELLHQYLLQIRLYFKMIISYTNQLLYIIAYSVLSASYIRIFIYRIL